MVTRPEVVGASRRRWPVVLLVVLGVGLMVSTSLVARSSTRYAVSALPFGGGFLLVFWAVRLQLRRRRQ
jgi:hypothetical protein